MVLFTVIFSDSLSAVGAVPDIIVTPDHTHTFGYNLCVGRRSPTTGGLLCFRPLRHISNPADLADTFS